MESQKILIDLFKPGENYCTNIVAEKFLCPKNFVPGQQSRCPPPMVRYCIHYYVSAWARSTLERCLHAGMAPSYQLSGRSSSLQEWTTQKYSVLRQLQLQQQQQQKQQQQQQLTFMAFKISFIIFTRLSLRNMTSSWMTFCLPTTQLLTGRTKTRTRTPAIIEGPADVNSYRHAVRVINIDSCKFQNRSAQKSAVNCWCAWQAVKGTHSKACLHVVLTFINWCLRSI